MKNPFKKDDHSGLILALVVGAVATGALAYLFLTESGNELRRSAKHKLKNKAKNLAAGAISSKTGIRKKIVKAAADQVIK